MSRELLAEVYGGWQATTSRVISVCTSLIAHALESSEPTVEDLDPTAQLVVDGALLQCWPWKNHPELDLRQAQDHRTQCAQVTCAPRAAWPGSVTPRTGESTTSRTCAALDGRGCEPYPADRALPWGGAHDGWYRASTEHPKPLRCPVSAM